MKHRTHKDFPSYRFYSDGRIKNKTTNHFIKVKRKGITVQKYFAELFPNLYTWEDKRSTPKPTYIPIRKVNKKRRKYNPKFIKAIQEKANYKTWDELVKEYNIPMGSIGYLLKKGKDKPSDQVIINIDRVIIRK